MKRFHVIEIRFQKDANPIKKKLLSTDWLHKAILYSASKASVYQLQEDLFTKKTHEAEMGWSDRYNTDNGVPTHLLIIKKVKKKNDEHSHSILISEAVMLKCKKYPEELT